MNKKNTLRVLKDMIEYKEIDVTQVDCIETELQLEEEVEALKSAIHMIEFMEYSIG